MLSDRYILYLAAVSVLSSTHILHTYKHKIHIRHLCLHAYTYVYVCTYIYYIHKYARSSYIYYLHTYAFMHVYIHAYVTLGNICQQFSHTIFPHGYPNVWPPTTHVYVEPKLFSYFPFKVTAVG